MHDVAYRNMNGMRGRKSPLPLSVRHALAKVGADLRDARRRRRIPTATMAERAMISRTTLSKVEKGDTRAPPPPARDCSPRARPVWTGKSSSSSISRERRLPGHLRHGAVRPGPGEPRRRAGRRETRCRGPGPRSRGPAQADGRTRAWRPGATRPPARALTARPGCSRVPHCESAAGDEASSSLLRPQRDARIDRGRATGRHVGGDRGEQDE